MLSKHVKFVILALLKVVAVINPIAGVIDAIVDVFKSVYGKDER